jgi:MFS transporter, MHS family, shikimate and dehydroshikimate transport protein
VAAYLIALCLVSLVAFVAAPEMKDIDIADAGPA